MTEAGPNLDELAQKIRDGIYVRGMPVVGANRDVVLADMDRYMRANGYEYVRTAPDERALRQVRDRITEMIRVIGYAIDSHKPALDLALERRRHSSEVRDALKWVAAFSTAALFLCTQLLRRGPAAELIPLSDVRGVMFAAISFLVSIVAAGVFVLAIDLQVAEWLAAVSLRATVAEDNYRQCLRAYADAEAALDRGDVDTATATVASAQEPLAAANAAGRLADYKPTSALVARWSLGLCVGGFGAGILALAGDVIAKMPLHP